MDKPTLKAKRKEWLRRYVPAEILGTITAVTGASTIYAHTQSFLAATAGGWFGEGIGFYGYFIATELIAGHRKYAEHKFFKRISLAVASASTNLLVEFLPAELLDNFVIRPFAMFEAPHYIHPYPIGFLVGKFSADIIFYALAILGYESRKRWLHH